MSSALVRQALALVDPEEHETKKKRARVDTRSNWGQGKSHPYKNPKKNVKKQQNEVKEDTVESNIKKLLELSKPVAKPKQGQKIVERALKGKPLLEKVEKKEEPEQSILFPEESFKSFEKTYFCK